MALVNSITFSMTDYSGDPRTVRVFTEAGLTFPQMQSLVDTLAPLLDDVTGMRIEGASITLAAVLPAGLKVAAVDNVDAERGINWNFDAANTQYSYTIRTPGALPGNVNGEALVPTPETAAWTSGVLTGDAVNAPTDTNANDLIAFNAAKVTFQK